MNTRICSKCHQEKSLEGFPKNKFKKEGRTCVCRKCTYQLYIRPWRLRNLEKVKKEQRAFRVTLKEDVLAHYGNNKIACVICGYNNPKALSVDHINGGGKKHRDSLGASHGIGFYLWLRREHYPEGYQTLCMNCQWEKR